MAMVTMEQVAALAVHQQTVPAVLVRLTLATLLAVVAVAAVMVTVMAVPVVPVRNGTLLMAQVAAVDRAEDQAAELLQVPPVYMAQADAVVRFLALERLGRKVLWSLLQ